MRNRKSYLLVACILVVALMATLVIGCTPKSEGPNISLEEGNSNDTLAGSKVLEGNIDKFINFELFANAKVKDVDKKVTVIDANRNVVNSKLVPIGGGVYKLYAPNGGYKIGTRYVVSLGDGVSFIDYQGVAKIQFTPNINMESNVAYKDGVIVIDSKLVNARKAGNNPETGTEFGVATIMSANNAIELAVGDIFIVDNKETGLQQAFKVEKLDKVGNIYSIDYVKPSLEEIYDDFTYSGVEVLDNDNKDQLEMFAGKSIDAVEAELANSNMAQAIAGVFGAAPKFNVDVKLEGKEVVATITITVSNVVYTDGSNADLVFVIQNRLGAVVTSKISNDKVNNIYDVNFDVKAAIENKVLFNVGVFAKGAYSRVDNIQGIVDKLTDINNAKIDGMDKATEEEIIAKVEAVEEATKTNKDDVNVKIFKWTLPIADGAASVSYDADLAFNFSFSGQFGVAAETTLKYDVGASYDSAHGIETYAHADENNKACDKVSIKLDGKAQVKVGINQRVGLDVLAGVLGVGLRANLGNFNRLYGYADASWVAAPTKNDKDVYDMVVDDDFKGTMYLEGGIYWDVNVDLGVKIGSLINLNKGVNIATGEKVLYTGGSPEVVRNVVADGTKKNEVFTLASQVTKLDFDKYVYNVLAGKYQYVDLASADVNVVAPQSSKYTVAKNDAGDWELNILNISDKIDSIALEVSYTYENAFKQVETVTDTVLYSYSGAVVLDSDTYVHDKANDPKKNLVVKVSSTNGAPQLAIDGVNVGKITAQVGSEYDVTVDYKTLNKLVSGKKVLTATVGNAVVKADLDIVGRVSVLSEIENGTIYKVYCADQILDLAARALSFSKNAIFEIQNDIDMGGVTINTIPEFNAEIRGDDYVISNYKVNGNSLIAVNNGKIANLTFAGDVNVEIKSKSGADYFVAGVVALNKGTLTNVNFKGNVAVRSVGLQAFNDYYVGGVVAVNNGKMVNCDVLDDSNISVTYKFDLANVTYTIGAVDSKTADINAKIVVKCEAGATNNITKVAVAK